MNGPLSDDLLESMTKYFSRLCGVSMVLDPDSCGHEVFDENRGRYQWKVAGGRSADHQGIAFKVGGVTEVYVITRNRVDVVIRVRTERRHEIARMHPEEVVSPTFGAVFTEAMRPYVL